MGPITFATALLLIVSGGLKVRSGMRVGTGFSPFAALEVVWGLGLLAVALAGAQATALVPRWLVPSGVLFVFVSTAEHARRLRVRREARERTEAGRLEAYVQYLSKANEGEAEGDPQDRWESETVLEFEYEAKKGIRQVVVGHGLIGLVFGVHAVVDGTRIGIDRSGCDRQQE